MVAPTTKNSPRTAHTLSEGRAPAGPQHNPLAEMHGNRIPLTPNEGELAVTLATGTLSQVASAAFNIVARAAEGDPTAVVLANTALDSEDYPPCAKRVMVGAATSALASAVTGVDEASRAVLNIALKGFEQPNHYVTLGTAAYFVHNGLVEKCAPLIDPMLDGMDPDVAGYLVSQAPHCWRPETIEALKSKGGKLTDIIETLQANPDAKN